MTPINKLKVNSYLNRLAVCISIITNGKTQDKMSKARAWLGTLNNPDTTMVEAYLSKWFTEAKASYVNGQLEKGKEGTIHIQYFLIFPGQIRLAALKKICPKSHFEPVRRDNGASDYCLKEDTRLEGPWEFGIKPARRNISGDVASQNKRILELGPEKCVEEGLIHIKDYLKIKTACNTYHLNTTVSVDHTDTKGIWFWGKPGVGKSRKARADYPNAYLKPMSKWWDGYQGQKTVILDDLDTNVLGHYLKIWADRYHCTGEIKGGTVPLQHTHFIVTSNYSIDSLFNSDLDMASAIKRRFKVIHMIDPYSHMRNDSPEGGQGGT